MMQIPAEVRVKAGALTAEYIGRQISFDLVDGRGYVVAPIVSLQHSAPSPTNPFKMTTIVLDLDGKGRTLAYEVASAAEIVLGDEYTA